MAPCTIHNYRLHWHCSQRPLMSKISLHACLSLPVWRRTGSKLILDINGRFEQCILIVVVTWFGLGPTLGNLLPPHAFSRRRVAFSAPPCLSSNEQCMHLDRLGLREHTYSLEVKVRLRRALIPHYVYYVVRSPLTLPRSSQYRSGRPLVTCAGRPPPWLVALAN